MNKIVKNIMTVIVPYLLCAIVFFMLGMKIKMKLYNDYLNELENNIHKTQNVVEEIIERNNKMEKLLLNSEIVIKELKGKNNKLDEKLNSVNEICKEMKKDIDSASCSTEDGLSKIMLIQENQIKISEYIKEIEHIMNEEVKQ